MHCNCVDGSLVVACALNLTLTRNQIAVRIICISKSGSKSKSRDLLLGVYGDKEASQCTLARGMLVPANIKLDTETATSQADAPGA